MGAMSRRKGARGEVEVVNLLLPLFPDAVSTRSQQANGARQKKQRTPDIAGVPFRAEVRRQRRPNVREALRDAQQLKGAGPPVAFTRADRDEWLVTMRAADWLGLVLLAQQFGRDGAEVNEALDAAIERGLRHATGLDAIAKEGT